MGREYGVQLAKEALKILEEDPLNISTALGELLVGQFEDFDVGNYLTIKELYPTYLNSNKLLNDEIYTISEQIVNLCLDIIQSKRGK
jgi:hypothetical protein